MRDITDDESMSDSDERPHHKPHGAIFGGYFEQPLGSWVSCDVVRVVPRVLALAFAFLVAPRQQREAKCAIHALNNCLGGSSGPPVLLLVSAPAGPPAARL